ncbi:MAG: molecular chaperone HtpG, partial [Burkholderiaceae bacterium]
GTALQSVAKGAVDLGTLQDESEKQAAEQAAESFKPVLEKLREALKAQAKDVRTTSRLVDSPACLVVEDGETSTQLARLLKQVGQQAPEVKPILEVNTEHPMLKRLAQAEGDFDEWAQVLFDQAMLAEGALPANPAAYVQRVHRLLAA